MQDGYVTEIWRYPVKSMGGERLARAHVGARGVWGDRGWAIREEATGAIHNAKRHPVLLQCAAAYREEPSADRIPHVDIALPDGSTFGSDAPDAPARLSALMGRRVSLRPLQPATDLAYYRRREPGSGLVGRLARSRVGRRFVQWAFIRGRMAADMRQTFGRLADEPLPDFSDIPGDVFEFYTPPGTYFDVFPIHVLTTASLRRMAELNAATAWDVRRFRPNVIVDTGAAEGMVEHAWAGRAVRLGGVVITGEMPTIRCAMPMHAQRDLPRDPSVLRTIVRHANQCLGLYASVAQGGTVATGEIVTCLSS